MEGAEPRHVVDIGDARLDVGRPSRIGMPEAVYAGAKTAEQCVRIVATLLDTGDDPVIVTHVTDEQRPSLLALGPAANWGATLTWRHAAARDVAPVAIVSGGTSDRPVVDECRATLTAMGVPVEAHQDVGVAGLHRLMDVVPALDEVTAVVAVAGMEASLPTVLAGLVAGPIIAVPTSTGYGASLEGVTALLSMLASCAPGITVVGIDNGYGAACAVLRVAANL